MTGESEPEVTADVLGTLVVRVDGVPVSLGHTRQKAVLVVLLTEAGQVVPPDRLIERVWGERPPSRARSVLRTYLSHLRRALAGTGITITWRGTGYLVTAGPGTVDLHRFRRLLTEARSTDDPWRASALADEALGLWRGEPLAELDTPWAHSTREHLRREHAAARADWIDWALTCGRHGELVPELLTRATDDPLDERLAGQLMLALYYEGRQADALEHYQRTRRQLAEELGTDPGPALQDLHHRILSADSSLVIPESRPARESGPAAVPRQLPAPPLPFVGRRDELEHLDAVFTTAGPGATVVISAIAGAGGIGKTWLALHWAHRHIDDFPDGQLFVDLRGFSPDGEAMNSAAAVRGFLDALGVEPGRLPADLHAQAALFRSLVAGKRMLIVLDNAADTGHVSALLPGGRSCTVLVTSRNRLTGLVAGHGAQHFPLDLLTKGEALALLRSRLGADRVDAEPEAVADLLASCGRFPLALGIAAGRARTQPALSLASLAAELAELGLGALDSDDPGASVPAVLSWSLRALAPQEATAFALLSAAPGPDIGLPAATSLLALSPEQTHRTLQALVDASLLDRDVQGRYTMHDLIRAYATTLTSAVPEPERQAALDRVVDFYLQSAVNADRLLDPHRAPIRLGSPSSGVRPQPMADLPDALAWLDVHHPHLLAAQHVAARLHRDQKVWHLAWALSTFHGRRGHRHDKFAVWRAALDAAGRLHDPVARIFAHRLLGSAHAELQRHSNAIEHLHQALDLAQAHGDRLQQARTYDTLAWAWARQGDPGLALENSRYALELFRALEQPVWEANALNTVGWYAAQLGDYDTARNHCEAALTLHRRHQDLDGEAEALDSLGFIDHHTGRHHEALNFYEQSVALFRALGNTVEVARVLDGTGHPHLALGRPTLALHAWREAMELYREQGRDSDAERIQRQLDHLENSVAAGHDSAC
ncbi:MULTISPECIES: AfsR/SARP family transcriptional regulator [Amycolatopsis]|uniref:OmpR/PhoB-type domain-containing protein n=1 Tax=Amycolatopsis bullii TaxID=941987 RepID=A0ABQ3KPL6_9PSEU|nr:BTAD domain-containing putative transcriptional regulator [Amycolatopsis bullii]GHG42819.1 hypothetical protein GCM10017567_75990 [Amycolatopsis bullii]